MDMTHIKNQSLATVICDYLECQACRIVDRNYERTKSGFICPTCESVSDRGRLYFHINIHILVDLIQESYHSENFRRDTERLFEGGSAHDVSVVLFFCTLREALLDNLISHMMEAQNLPKGVTDQLYSDNRLYIQKQDKLFRALTGTKWSIAIRNIKASDIDYEQVNQFIESASKARNKFIHEGSKWSIDRTLSTKCLKSIRGLIRLYVSLHNTYVHPHYLKSLKLAERSKSSHSAE